jgi:hypothetical protein
VRAIDRSIDRASERARESERERPARSFGVLASFALHPARAVFIAKILKISAGRGEDF